MKSMIQLVLVGCAGRMGRVIADCVRQREDCVISAGVDTAAKGDETFPVYSACCDIAEPADAVIDFSHPSALEGTLAFARERKIPVVMATTGLGDEHKALLEQASQTIPVFTSANMSVGVNLIRELCAKAAQILEDGYDIEIVEAHHNQKLDAPSGTALMLADAIVDACEEPKTLEYDRHTKRQKRSKNEIGMHAIRGGTITGEHTVLFAGHDEIITISHSARSREVFATGALRAALFLVGKQPGSYCMSDLMKD